MTWNRFWLLLGASVGLLIGVASLFTGTREALAAGAIMGGVGLVCAWWLLASFVDTAPDLAPDQDGIVKVPMSRTSGIMSNIGMLSLAFALGGSQMVSDDSMIANLAIGALGLASAAFAAYAFLGLFQASKGGSVMELHPGELRVGAILPWRVVWSDCVSVAVEPFAGKPYIAIRFKREAHTRAHPEGWFNPPVAPVPLYLPVEDTKADRDQLYKLVIDYWQRGRSAA